MPHKESDRTLTQRFVPTLQVLQFSVASLKGALNLQCKFDGAMIRLGFGLMAPVAPVLVVLCCLGMEAIDHGFGIAAALKATQGSALKRAETISSMPLS